MRRKNILIKLDKKKQNTSVYLKGKIKIEESSGKKKEKGKIYIDHQKLDMLTTNQLHQRIV